MKRILSISLVCLLISFSHAQQYNTAVGFKGNWSSTNSSYGQVTVKHFFTEQSAFEFNVGGNQSFGWLQAMYERSQRLNKVFDWYWGAGADLGCSATPSGGRDTPTVYGFWTGIDGVAGLEHTFDGVPINIALDMGPTLRIVPDVKIGWTIGFAMRYAFGH